MAAAKGRKRVRRKRKAGTNVRRSPVTGPIAVPAVAMAVTAGLMLACPRAADAAEHLVRLLMESEAGRFRFEPELVLAEPGDEIRFEPDSRLHAVKSIAGMLPEGAPPWRGRMGEAVALRLEQPGVYGVKCPAHYSLGMVALILVGHDPPNWAEARAVRHPPAAAAAMSALFGEAACRLGPAFAAQCPAETRIAQPR